MQLEIFGCGVCVGGDFTKEYTILQLESEYERFDLRCVRLKLTECLYCLCVVSFPGDPV